MTRSTNYPENNVVEVVTDATSIVAPKQAIDLTVRDLSWFAGKVKQGAEKMFSEVVTITPAIARRLLEQNADNRPISPKYIKQIAHDIRSKQWEVNGETIIVSADGWLNDGQNRLLGVIEADVPVQCFVVFGVSRKSRMSVDMGRVRTVAHYLGMQHTSNSNFAAIIASQWAAFELGYYGKLTGSRDAWITKQDVLRFHHDHAQMIDNAINLYRNKTKNLGSQGTGILTAYCILQTKDPLYTNDFYEALIEGSGLDRDNVILELRNRLISGAGLSPYNKIELIVRYWMAWKDGKKNRKKIALRTEWPANFGDYGREPPAHEEE